MTTRRLLVWAGLGAAVFVVGLVAGIVFAESAPDVAARQVVREFVVREAVSADLRTDADVAPTSGGNPGTATCGRADTLTISDAIASLDAGLTVIWTRSVDLVALVVSELEAGSSPLWAVAVDERLDQPVVATAWGVRMALTRPDGQLLRAFVVGYAGQRGPPPACG